MQVKGYKVLGVPLGEDASNPFSSFLYVRQHSSKGYGLSCSLSLKYLLPNSHAHPTHPHPPPIQHPIARKTCRKDEHSS